MFGGGEHVVSPFDMAFSGVSTLPRITCLLRRRTRWDLDLIDYPLPSGCASSLWSLVESHLAARALPECCGTVVALFSAAYSKHQILNMET